MSIDKKDLRLGNWIELPNKIVAGYGLVSKYVQVDTISKETAHWTQATTDELSGSLMSGTKYEDCIPIPISNEVLEKVKDFGIMTKDGEKSYFNGDDFIIRLQDMAVFAHSETDGSVFYLTRLKYVHQLQNLYFALHNIELQITL